jgi:hypothetical protein
LGLGTGHQLARAARHPQVCFPALDKAGVLYTRLDDAPKGEKCGLYNALTLDRTLTPYSATLRMTCGEAAALYVWERHVARPAAVEILGSPLARIETYGSFSCRNIAGSGRLSEHAHGNAVDISGFRLEDGRLIDVKTHWGKGGKEAKFLKKCIPAPAICSPSRWGRNTMRRTGTISTWIWVPAAPVSEGYGLVRQT